MGFGSKKFWRSVATFGLSLAPGGAVVKAGAGLVLSEFLKPDSEEKKRFKAWVEFAEAMDTNPHIDGAAKWEALESRVRDDLERYYGEEPKNHDVLFNASAALKEARREFEA